MAFLGVLEENRYFCVLCVMYPSAGILLQVQKTVARGCGCLTGFASYFLPFYAMQEGNWWMVDHEPARRGKSRFVCCLLSTPVSRGDVLEVSFLVDNKCNGRRC